MINEMENKQTAVIWLTNYMKANFHLTDESIEIFEQAKQMEKEQIMEAFKIDDNGLGNDEWAEQYYNETYNEH